MKPYSSFQLSRWQNIGIRGSAALIVCALIAWLAPAMAIFGLFAAAFNPDGFASPLLGASYTRINATTKSNLTGQNADIQEELANTPTASLPVGK